MTEELRSEKEVVKKLQEMLAEQKPGGLRKCFVHVNLGTRKFHDIWADWWKTATPPRLEVDMIPIFEELDDPDKIFTAGVEVEFFKNKKVKTFYDGLQQVLSFGLLGFDSLVLWHIFSAKLANEDVEKCVKPVKEMVEGFSLPITYIATKLTENLKYEFFAPWELYSSSQTNIDYVFRSMRNLCSELRNPLLNKAEVEKRKKILKVVLRIPI